MLLSLPSAAWSQDADSRVVPPEPIFRTGAPSIGEVIEEHAYYFRRLPYDPVVAVEPVATREEADTSTPEGTAIAMISAMLRGDYPAWRGLWTTESVAVLEARDREQGQDPDFWRAAWKRALTDKRVELTDRVETGPYVLIAYQIVDPEAPQAEPLELAVALERVEDRWLLTQRLREDPVLLQWRHPGSRNKIMARGVHGQ